MSQKQDNLIVALDIGSMSTRVLAADVNEGALRYRGHAVVDSLGMRKGLVADWEFVEEWSKHRSKKA